MRLQRTYRRILHVKVSKRISGAAHPVNSCARRAHIGLSYHALCGLLASGISFNTFLQGRPPENTTKLLYHKPRIGMDAEAGYDFADFHERRIILDALRSLIVHFK